ncbi:sorbitol operon transcription regulator [Gracilibacillus boraciitolerans JCM 21714]|uniref:Sorbitol operon transcription regulator n=1 Tax=Gracilibacillus boraciitolerans JCM 21714 TaxID=1298598 RepID=W4VI38_9BACI|nr:BglG family transcription antiterminator [Gracilibacillus boraciitolerans]GAE93065.1 sorbitol operon transcription regulator [Gracilibacillus boraciitolerans JCM 21714]
MSDFMLEDKEIQIIELTQKREYSSLNFLAESLGVGTRTIRNYIKKLNGDLEGTACIENKRGKGFWLSIQNQSNFENLMEKVNFKKNIVDSPKRRIAFVIDKLINSEEKYTLDELAFQMNIGRTTLVNELKKASVSLEAYNLKIYGKPNTGMNLSGDELDIRFFIMDNVFDVLYRSYPLDHDIAEEIIKSMIKYDFESTTQKRLMEFVIVMLDRLLNNRPLEKIPNNFDQLRYTFDYKIGLEIATIIEKRLPVTIPEIEILFLTIPIAGRRTPANNRTMADISIPDEIKELQEQIVENIGFNKNVIKENHSFFTDLQYHLTFMLNRLMFGLRIENPMLADLKEKYPVAFRMAKIAGEVIENKYDLKVSDDEIGYIAFYFEVFISQGENKVKHLRNAAIICGTGRGTAKLVANQLGRILNQNTELILFSETEVTEDVLNEFDIIFSTIKLPCETTTPVIIINEIFDEHRISRKVEEIAYLQTFMSKADSSTNNSILNHLISEDCFFILDSETGYDDNLSTIVDKLINIGQVDTRFLKRLRERDKKGSMVFDRYIALPHTFNHKSEQIKLALGIFPKEVVKDGKEVKLIFLLGVPEQQSEVVEHQLVNIYDEIIRIANNTRLIDQLASVTCYNEASEILKKVNKFN